MTARSLVLLLPLIVGASCAGDEPGPVEQRTAVPVPSEARLAELDAALVQAIREGAARLELAGSDPRGWLELGMTYEAHSMHEEALLCYLEATRLADTDPRAWLRLGLAQAKAGELPLAITALERLLELDGDYEPARVRLGYLHLDAGDTAGARTVFEEVLARTPREPVALQGLAQCDLDEGQPQAALDRLATDFLAEGAHRPLTQRLRGLALARLGRSAEAEAALAEGIAAKPSIQDPWSREVGQFKVGLSALIMRAQKLVDRGKGAAALKLVEVHRDSGDPRVLRLLGAAYGREERFADAAEVLAEAFQLEPDDPELALALAAAYSQEFRNGEARGVLREFVERHPQHVAPWRGLQELAVGSAAHARALALRDEAREAGHRDAELEAVAGRSALALGRWQDAAVCFDLALSLGSATADLHLDRARARLELGAREGAEEDVIAAAVLEPSHPRLKQISALLEQDRDE